jgi:surface antigen
MKLRLTGIFGLLTILAVSTVLAQNTMFLRKSPIAHLNEDDRKILRETIDQALESPDGTVIDWSNETTGSGGRVKILDTDESGGTVCRNIRARNQARGRQADGIYRLCKDENGVWRFAGAGKSELTEPEQTDSDDGN